MRLDAVQLIMDVPLRGDGRALDVSFEPGQVWGVLGPNGAGKTTLLHTLAGLRRQRSGDIRISGTSLDTMKRRLVAQNMGMVFQDRQDSFPATVLETALIGRHPFLSPWEMETALDRRMAIQSLARLDVEHLAERLVNTLSGGERQRVALATVLTQSPPIWLADEPTNHLDLHHQVAVMNLLAGKARAGCTVIMSLHDPNLAARWCSHLLLLYPDGEACWGPARQMLVPEVLEGLYGQKLVAAELEGAPVFVPYG